MFSVQGNQVQNDSYTKLMLTRAMTLIASPHFSLTCTDSFLWFPKYVF